MAAKKPTTPNPENPETFEDIKLSITSYIRTILWFTFKHLNSFKRLTLRKSLLLISSLLLANLSYSQWIKKELPTGFQVSFIKDFDDTLYLYIESSNTLYNSIDNGETWQAITSPQWPGQVVNDISINHGSIFIAAKDGLYYSWNNFQNIEKLSSVNGNVQKVYNMGNNIVILSDKIYVSATNGANWQAKNLNSVRDITKTANNIFFATTDSSIYKSIDSGYTWQTVLGFTNDSILNLSSNQNNVIISTYNSIKYSLNSGMSWTSVSVPNLTFEVKCTALMDSTIILGTRSGLMKIDLHTNVLKSYNIENYSFDISTINVRGNSILIGSKVKGYYKSINGDAFKNISIGNLDHKFPRCLISANDSIYLGTSGLFVSNLQSSWNLISQDLHYSTIVYSAFKNYSTLLVGTNNGLFYWDTASYQFKQNKSIQLGTTIYWIWNDTTSVYLATSNGPYRSYDGYNWVSLKSNIIPARIDKIVSNANFLYLLGNNKIYSTLKNNVDWKIYDKGLGNNLIFDLYSDGKDVLALTNESVWRIGDLGIIRRNYSLNNLSPSKIIMIDSFDFISTQKGLFACRSDNEHLQILDSTINAPYNAFTFVLDTLVFANSKNIIYQSLSTVIENINKLDTITSSIEITKAKSIFKIFPTICTQNLNINVDNEKENYQISIINQVGQCILKSKSLTSDRSIDLIGIPPGLYHLQISTSHHTQYSKIIIE
jgi:hypothetical protein